MKLKKIAIAVIATMTMATGALGITANAAGFSFNFSRGQSGYSSAVKKTNYNSYAAVTPTSGNLSSTAYIYVRTYNQGKTSALSSSYKLSKVNNNTTKVFYSSTTPSYNTSVCLKGNCGYDAAWVAGAWTP